MIKTISVNEISIQTIIALTRKGDEIVIEENGEPLAKITPIIKNLEDEFSAWETAGDEDFLKFEETLAELK